MASVISVSLALALAVGTAFGQADTSSKGTFHLRVTVKDANDAVIPGAKVGFHGGQFDKIAVMNERGVYEIDLPFGTYTMSVEASHFQTAHRPLFRVTSSDTIAFEVPLRLQSYCDLVVVNPGRPTTAKEGEDAEKHFCGGEDSFPTPSRDGVPFQLLARYGGRDVSGDTYVYVRLGAPSQPPVSVAYNLFSLQADKVTFDAKSNILRATGHVVATDQFGTTQSADSMTFRIENGIASPIN